MNDKTYLVHVDAAPFENVTFHDLEEAIDYVEYLVCKSDDCEGDYEILEVTPIKRGTFKYNDDCTDFEIFED